jgi:endoglucanase
MALLAATIKKSVLAFVIFLAATVPGMTTAFSVKRGINLDIWTTWPDESRWSDRDVLLPYPEWRRTVGQAELTALRENGFDFVRMPVDPAPFLSEQTTAFREELFAEVLESVRLVNRSGLKVVVDMHLIPAGDNRSIGMREVMDDSSLFDRYVELVRAMAGTLAGEDPALVAFELMNEPGIDCEEDGTNFWQERQKRLFAAARASATRLTLVLTGACFSNADGLSKVDPTDYPDDNIIWGFHSYQPFLLTHQGATWAGDFIRYVAGLPYPPYAVPRAELNAALVAIREKIEAEAPWSRRSGMLAYLDEQIATIATKEKLSALMEESFDTVETWTKEHGIDPHDILLGEFGMIRQEYGNPFVMLAKYRAAYVKDMIDRAKSRGFAWSIWSYRGAFGIVEEFEGRKAEPEVLEMIRTLD